MSCWKSLVDKSFVLKNNKIKNLKIVSGPFIPGEILCLCSDSDVDKNIDGKNSIASRRPTAERIFLYRMLSKDPYTALALMTRAVLGTWTVMRGRVHLHDLQERAVFSLINDHLSVHGESVFQDIVSSSRQLSTHQITPATEHAKPEEVVRKAHAQFVKQLAGRTVILFGESPLAA